MATHRVIIETRRIVEDGTGHLVHVAGDQFAVNPAHVSTIRPNNKHKELCTVTMTNGNWFLMHGSVAAVNNALN